MSAPPPKPSPGSPAPPARPAQAKPPAKPAQARKPTAVRKPLKVKPKPWPDRLIARMKAFRPRVLPVTIFAAVLMLGVRVGDLWRLTTHDARLPEFPTTLAQGQQPTAVAKPGTVKLASADKPAEAKPPEGKPPEGKPPEGKPADGKPGEATTPQTYNVAPPGSDRLGPIDTELAQRYAERRAELERRNKELDQREALLAVAEKRIDQKVQELEKLRADVQKMLRVNDDKQGAQVESLVKIYESMKPKEAARIFEELDMPVLIDVFQKMKEAKTAPILAAMDPAKAKALTTALIERRIMPGASLR